MMFFLTICAFLAPSAVAAAAFPWNGPQATIFAPAADVWSPAPTSGPGYSAMGLFERQAQGEVKGDNTCGYISASSESSVTCPNKSQICATNTFNGVHGCCDPDSLSSSCIIPTSCIPSSLMSASCTNKACSEDLLVTKCTNDAAPYCYQWLFVYARTTMTQHGCGVSEFTSTATRTYGTGVMSIPSEYAAVTVTETVTQTDSSSDSAQNSNSSSKKTNVGAIAGGAVGGVLGLAAIVFGVWFFLRRRKAKAANSKPPPATHHHHSLSQSSQFQPVTEYNPHGFPAAYTDNDNKTWHSPQSTYNSPHSPMPQYPGQIQWGAVEISGTTRVEAPS